MSSSGSKGVTTVVTKTGFVQGTQIGVDVTEGVTVTLNFDINIRAKSESSIWQQLQSQKEDFSDEVWKEMEAINARVGGGFGFFWGLLGLGVSGGYNTSSSKEHTKRVFTDDKTGKAVTDVLKDTEEQVIKLSGKLEATGIRPLVPASALVFVELMQVQMTSDDKTQTFNVISNSPKAVAAEQNGDTSGIKSGESDTKLDILPSNSSDVVEAKFTVVF